MSDLKKQARIEIHAFEPRLSGWEEVLDEVIDEVEKAATLAERKRITKALPEPITDESDDFIKGSNAMLQLVIEAIKNKDTEDMHPMNCDTPYSGSCRHCERAQTAEHDPAICALCDPEYDHLPNKYRNTPSAITTKDEQQQ